MVTITATIAGALVVAACALEYTWASVLFFGLMLITIFFL